MPQYMTVNEQRIRVADQILEANQTVGRVWTLEDANVTQMQIVLLGLDASSQEWQPQILPRQLEDSSTEWVSLLRAPFAHTAGAASVTLPVSPDFKYRIANTNDNPTNSGVTAYIGLIGLQ